MNLPAAISDNLQFQWPTVVGIFLMILILTAVIWLTRSLENGGRDGSSRKNGRRSKRNGPLEEFRIVDPDTKLPGAIEVPRGISSLPPMHQPPELAAETDTVGSAREPRHRGSFRALMRQSGAKPIAVKMWDLSAGGFCAEWPHKLQVGSKVYLLIDGTASQAATVAWTSEFIVGCKFETRLHAAVFRHIVHRAGDFQY